LNAANEIAVAAFLGGHIGFLDIASIVESVLAKASRVNGAPADLEEIYEIDRIARIHAEELVHLVSR
ncbi:MAG: 1-deoxy-D-xylulose-5-phosphate reductoisomerase, partial [Parvibaculum sp.]